MTESTFVIRDDGAQVWHDSHNRYHRDDGPAMIRANGIIEWFKHGVQHRENGPAFVNKDRNEEQWCIEGKTHRIDGPAVRWHDGSIAWYINDIDISSSVEEWLKENNITYPFDEEEKLLFKLRFL